MSRRLGEARLAAETLHVAVGHIPGVELPGIDDGRPLGPEEVRRELVRICRGGGIDIGKDLPQLRFRDEVRLPEVHLLIILTDSNSDLITYRVGVPGEFSNDLFHTTTYTGTYYIIAGPYDDLVTGRYLIYVSCATAPPTCATPTISVQPVTVRAGTSAVLTASASGGSPFKYSWFDQDEPFIALWDGATYTTPPLYRSSSYEVVATNSCGKQARSVATVSVTPVKRRAVRK